MSALILVAEDDPDIQLIARLALKKAGYRAEVFDNGRLLLDRLRTGARPDLIVLDWMMPELDGPSTHALLKADASTSDIPVVLMTAASEAASRFPGVAGWIGKPLDPTKLGDCVRIILESA